MDIYNSLVSLGRELMGAFYGSETIGLTACAPAVERPEAPEGAGVHLNVPVSSADSWSSAADHVLRWYCGVAEPTNEQTVDVGQALRRANEQHIADDPDPFAQECYSPIECDHRIFRIFDRGSVEIFIPTPTPEDICLQEPLPDVPLVPPPVEQPDAGTDAPKTDVSEVDKDTGEVEPPTPAPSRRPGKRPRTPKSTKPPPTKKPAAPVVPLP